MSALWGWLILVVVVVALYLLVKYAIIPFCQWAWRSVTHR